MARSRCCFLVKKKSCSETGKRLCLIRVWVVAANPGNTTSTWGMWGAQNQWFQSCPQAETSSCCLLMQHLQRRWLMYCCAYGTWLGCSVFTKLGPAAHMLPKCCWRWENLAPERCFLVTASRSSWPQGKAHPFVNNSPFQYLSNMFSVSPSSRKNPKENSWG